MLSRKKDEEVSDEKREQVKLLRDQIKKGIASLQEQYFYQSPQEMLEELKAGKVSAQMLLMLASEFGMRFTEKKRERNLLDFSDLEHLALQILVKKENGNVVPGEAALAFSKQFEEIMIDEYQDSNMVQELILTSISRCSMGQNNLFMVGDVKQSIYRFRLACPELFMEKYDTYTTEDSENQKIELHKNFRSRKEVLFDVNFIFRKIMHRNLGNVEYDDNAALYAGIEFPELVTNVEMDDLTAAKSPLSGSEILLFDADSVTETNAREAEARMIGGQIKAIVGRELVYDKESRHYRKAEYRDIVILLRSLSGWSEEFLAVLSDMGIPAYTGTRSGYFSALEVRTVLSFLRVLDNPRQDIPFTAVLTSPIGTFATEELAKIRTENPEVSYYEACRAYENVGSDGILREKLQKFFKVLEHFRSCVPYTPMHELLWKIYEETGYFDYVCAMPAGSQRKANLEMLAEKAAAYESTSYRGLFNFVRYIENLQKYEVDFGEVNLADAGNGAVQIMTIHKSKGLEFPIVFAAGMGKQFNFQDINSRFLIHPDMGFGVDVILPEKRLILSAVHKQIIRRQLQRESLGEELRVLYVALTRAKEKLIITGCIGKLPDVCKALSVYMDHEEPLLPIAVRGKAKTYWSYILPALARHPAMQELLHEYGITERPAAVCEKENAQFIVHKVTVTELVQGEILGQTDTQMQEKLLKEWDSNRIYDEEIHEFLEKRFSYQYPHAYLRNLPVKVSVSELKKRSWHGENDREEALFSEPDIVPLVPDFVSGGNEEYKGAARGTAYHRLMECLDYMAVDSESQIHKQITALTEAKKMAYEEAQCIRIQDIMTFLHSEIGQRMKKAFEADQLYREQPFVLAQRMKNIEKDWNGEETVLVQGIIDAYFIEDEEIVLVDYKTDRVRKGEEQHLIDLYHTQLEDYAQALERMLQKKVKETYIYSFALGKMIPV